MIAGLTPNGLANLRQVSGAKVALASFVTDAARRQAQRFVRLRLQQRSALGARRSPLSECMHGAKKPEIATAQQKRMELFGVCS